MDVIRIEVDLPLDLTVFPYTRNSKGDVRHMIRLNGNYWARA